ncbi:hypothetical protein [Streptomyces sp. x-19]|uniref:hypothetical protein n=1 Tax=Streptomyces sp. x-19 TaxID=2789280 RepID=UPI00397F6EB8
MIGFPSKPPTYRAALGAAVESSGAHAEFDGPDSPGGGAHEALRVLRAVKP